MSGKINPRATAAKLAWQIIDKGQSLDAVIGDYFFSHEMTPQDRGLVQELVYGVCRWYGELDDVAAALLTKPIRQKDRVIHFLLLVGLYQLRHLGTAEHAAVAETVAGCRQLNKLWAKNLLNGCLRSYLREQDSTATEFGEQGREAVAEQAARDKINHNQLSHPEWIVAAIRRAWPEHSDTILDANNQRPPMCLRVNSRYGSRDNYLAKLAEADLAASPDCFARDGIVLEKPVPVTLLPDFESGAVSVQDTAAQLACDILDAHRGHSVLDACAAPGGKTAHILERTDNQVNMHALDISERRCIQLQGTLDRLQLNAQVFAADASSGAGWPTPDDGYDRILIDAPCSGLGVIRRHPDIKHHRRTDDIVNLNEIQRRLINQLWLLLKPGGLLLYMTCSILPSENLEQVKLFLGTHTDAHPADFIHPHALDLEFGKQTLPGVHNMDGFYYCLLKKAND